MRRAISRQNANDPDSSDETLLGYLNDFVSLTMGDEVQLFEQYGTLIFDIDETNDSGIYTFNDVGADTDFVNITGNGFISLTDPPAGSLSWNPLTIFIDPYEFFMRWGVQNTDVLTPGAPTQMLYYGDQFTFRTIPNTEYTVTLYGYKKQGDFSTVGDPLLEFDYHLRFFAYGAAVNYGMDFRFADNIMASLRRDYGRETRLMLTHTHNQVFKGRGFPNF